jgi:hypothetical protein
MNNTDRWNNYIEAITTYATRTGHARVPASHVEVLGNGTTVNLGAWVGYVRQRQRAGLMSTERKAQLDTVPGWTWGPLRPGPITDTERDNQIITLRSTGVSLQKIGDQYGLSRQRIHQIVSGANSKPVPVIL